MSTATTSSPTAPTIPPAQAIVPLPEVEVSKVEIPQYSVPAILGVWAATAVPMAVLAWLVAPALADGLAGTGDVPMIKALVILFTGGVIWQFVLVVALVWREQRNLRWSTVREALWLSSPRSPRSGRIGGKLWLIVIPLTVAFAASPLLIPIASPDNRDFGTFLGSDAGQSFMSGNWGFYGLLLVMFLAPLSEELLFRGFLLPRMNRAFGRGDWAANGVLFAAYHIHMPWVILPTLFDMFTLAYPTKRYRSTWIGIAVHGSQTVLFAPLALALVL
jgi:membrane protease YdiL (CAAX protease family)